METPEIEKDSGKNKEENQSSYIPGKPYSKLRRELSDDELSNPAVQKLLISEIDKLELRVAELAVCEKNYYEVDKGKAVLEEKLKVHSSQEILYSFCLSIGSAIMGLSSLVKLNETGWIFLLVGGLLIIGGILSKLVKWN
jgi:hypothetical protein